MDEIVKDAVDYTLFLCGIPSTQAERVTRKLIIRTLVQEFGICPKSVGRLTRWEDFWHIWVYSQCHVARLRGKSIKMHYSHSTVNAVFWTGDDMVKYQKELAATREVF